MSSRHIRLATSVSALLEWNAIQSRECLKVIMDKLSVLFTIKSKIRMIEQRLASADLTKAEEAKKELRNLAEDFHSGYEQFMSSEQLGWASEDPDYLSFLLEEAIVYYKQMLIQGKEF
jgi:hypothetical protein